MGECMRFTIMHVRAVDISTLCKLRRFPFHLNLSLWPEEITQINEFQLISFYVLIYF